MKHLLILCAAAAALCAQSKAPLADLIQKGDLDGAW